MVMLLKCPSCYVKELHQHETRTFYRVGTYYRVSDGQHIQRYLCRLCKKHFSKATFNDCYRQNKRHKNEAVKRALCGLVSQRETARILNINVKTVARKLLYWKAKAELIFKAGNLKHPPAVEVEFDDLETFEMTKCKPLSVTLMVEFKSRRILGLQVSKMPAKGRLTHKALRLYGPRPDERAQGREKLFSEVKHLVDPHALIRSDSNPHYPADVKRHFPKACHVTVLGGRGASTGQGELKKLEFDPIFSLNHTCAMFRANVNRLIRKTWCTTKRQDRLEAHLMLYAMSHNQRIEQKRLKKLRAQRAA